MRGKRRVRKIINEDNKKKTAGNNMYGAVSF